MNTIGISLLRSGFMFSSFQNRFHTIIVQQHVKGDENRVRKYMDMQQPWRLHSLLIVSKTVRLLGKVLWA
jgi:hypothetical protein